MADTALFFFPLFAVVAVVLNSTMSCVRFLEFVEFQIVFEENFFYLSE